MLARTSDRNAHHLGSFAQAKILVKHQVQGLALPPRQTFQSVLKQSLRFGLFKSLARLSSWRYQRLGSFGTIGPSQLAQKVLAMLADRSLANHCKQPCLQTSLAPKTRFAFKDLQIDGLQNFFGLSAVTPATMQGPAETRAVERLQFSLKLRDVHSVFGLFPRIRSVFEVLVA